MAVGAHRQRGRTFGPAMPREREVKRGGRRAALLGSICAGVLLVGVAAPAAAQQTLIIGSGVPVIGRGGGGVVINNEVLDSLGPAVRAPALPYQAPAAWPAIPGAPGIAYRQPNTGLLMVTRPGTLLFPPPAFPKSKVTVQTPATPRLAQVPAPRVAAAAPQLQSRLLVPPAPKMEPVPVEPVTEEPVAAPEPPPQPVQAEPAPKVAKPEPAPKPAEPAPAPKVAKPEPAPKPAEPEPEPRVAAEPAPSRAAGAPAPSPLIQELTQKPVPAPAPPPAATQEAKAAAEPPPSPAPPAEPEPPAESTLQPVSPPLEPEPKPAPPTTVEAEPEPPPPPAKSLTEKPAAETQTAALPPAGALVDQVRVLFQEGSAVLSEAAKGQLTSVATFLEANTTVRVQLLAYAKATAESPSRARRLSLSRALAVRAFLIEQGVRSTRMDVRALGDKVPDGPVDRVDVLPQAVNQ